MAVVKSRINHGSFGEASSYVIKQLDYAGFGEYCFGFIELLEIKDPKPGKYSVVINYYDEEVGYWVYEFASLEQAQKAWRNASGLARQLFNEKIKSAGGFVKFWNYRFRQPWFYDLTKQEAETEENL